jgi:hypothetical protein
MSFWHYVSAQQGVLDPHWSLTGPLRQLRELGVVLRMHDRAGSCPALRNETEPEHYHGEAFSLFASLELSRRPPVNLSFANENGPSVPAVSVAIFKPVPVNCCALFEQSAG